MSISDMISIQILALRKSEMCKSYSWTGRWLVISMMCITLLVACSLDASDNTIKSIEPSQVSFETGSPLETQKTNGSETSSSTSVKIVETERSSPRVNYSSTSVTKETPYPGPILSGQSFSENSTPVSTETTQLPAPYPGPNIEGQTTPGNPAFLATETVQQANPYPGPNPVVQSNPSTTLTLATQSLQLQNPSPGVTSIHSTSITATEIVSITITPEIFIETAQKVSNPYNVSLASGGEQFIEFFSYWDPICKSMAPVLNKLEFQYIGRIKFVYLDIDDSANDQIRSQLGFSNQPQFYLIDGSGNILEQWQGYVSEAELISALSQFP
jgi:thiol-disulfide isomerase/thioredoxin